MGRRTGEGLREMNRSELLVGMVVTVLALVLAACGSPAGEDATTDLGGGADPAAGMCPQDEPDCVDTPGLDGDPVPVDETGVEQLRRDAQFYLGAAEGELNELVRVGRRGEEHMMLTEDYQIGRITVELDEVEGTYIVTSATVELPDGPETFELDG
jgi:hypothetical protein